VLFSDGTPSEKYFSVGIQIFPWIFAHTEIFEFPVVIGEGLPFNEAEEAWAAEEGKRMRSKIERRKRSKTGRRAGAREERRKRRWLPKGMALAPESGTDFTASA